jgi:hypothetical protein
MSGCDVCKKLEQALTDAQDRRDEARARFGASLNTPASCDLGLLYQQASDAYDQALNALRVHRDIHRRAA